MYFVPRKSEYRCSVGEKRRLGDRVFKVSDQVPRKDFQMAFLRTLRKIEVFY